MTVKISIKGPIISSAEKWIYDYFEEEATCAKDIREALPQTGEDIEVTINSYGGYVDQGAEIYTMLKAYPGKVFINVVAAYSAASVIAMAGNPTRISPVGRIMIHNASAENWGDYRDMDRMSDVLKNANQSMVGAYVQKTGLTKEDILQKMDKELWLTAEEAVSLGFADEIMFSGDNATKLVASGTTANMIPRNVIEKTKQFLISKDQKNESTKSETNDIQAIVEAAVSKAMSEFKTSIEEKQLPKGSNIISNKKTKSLIARLRKGE